MTTNIPKPKLYWPELDVLRGLAAVLMIVNHAGVRTLIEAEARQGSMSSVLFIGSFAPVLFFFVTGVGSGIQSSQKKGSGRWRSLLMKVSILFLADLLMHWSNGQWLGLDFLGFIGLSVLVLESVRRSSAPLTICTIGIVAISVTRFLINPLLYKLLGTTQTGWWGWDWILGTPAVPGVSYPLSPWMVYPLLGFIVGAMAMRWQTTIVTRRYAVIIGLIGLGTLPLVTSLILAWRQAGFFRWGTVSLAFFIVSFVPILLGLAGSMAMSAVPPLKSVQSALSLRGVASLAIVPIHYFWLDLLVSLGVKDLHAWAFSLLTIGLCIVTFLLARTTEMVGFKLQQIESQKLLKIGLITAIFLVSCVTLIYGGEGSVVAMYSRTIGQLILCLLLTFR
ncbi:heparan-alpha-glucosaminide N-acetyltransferase domain-containing protein [Pantanalinema rosaneae CENA516]|uniref:heparan-alpha-glucosaminide N-acetyltransferase domain-containing protein n=1 Tax=Pantanalinema rosaneae TaxID=1620701 RepID=UPI003D6E2E28